MQGSDLVHRSSHPTPARCLGGVHYLFGACRRGGVVSMTLSHKILPRLLLRL